VTTVGKPVAECQTILAFAATKDDGSGIGENRILHQLQSDHHHQHTNTQFIRRPDALNSSLPTFSEH